jgi:hypothetical protein
VADVGEEATAAARTEDPSAATGLNVVLPPPTQTAEALALRDDARDSTGRVQEPGDEAAAGATAGATAAQPLQSPAAVSAEAAADLPALPMVRGRVTDQAGAPLPGAQVSIPGTSIGALAGPDGRFVIALGESTDTLPSEPLTLSVARIGYASVTQVVGAAEAVSSPLEISLAEQALDLDQIVVTSNRGAVAERQTTLARAAVDEAPGSTVGPPSLGAPHRWRESTRSEAEATVGFALALLPDRPIQAIWITTGSEPATVSIEQRLEDGTRIVLVETRHAMDDAVTPSSVPFVSTVRGDVTIFLVGDLPDESLETLLQQLR